MVAKKASAALLIVALGLMGAKSSDVKEYADQEFAPDHGLVVLRVIREQSQGGSNAALTRDDKKLIAVLVSVEGRQKVSIEQIDQTRGFLLPAGRWYVEELRTPRDRDLPRLVRKEQAKIRSFEVIGGAINYAGTYNVTFPLDAEGRMSVEVNVDFGPELVQEAATAFPKAFSALPLLYCAVGRKCKPASEL